MYALFVYYKGEWRPVTMCPHEEHAVLFLAKVREELGEGHGYVVKMPKDPIEVSVADYDWDEEAKQLFGKNS